MTPAYRPSRSFKLAVMVLILLVPFAAAQAYVGPGAGLSLLSALWGLLCAIGAAFLFVIMWPIRRLRRKRREARQADARRAAKLAPQASQSSESSNGE